MTTDYEAFQQEETSEDSYFVSMTDIMVGMLFVFIILLMYFAFRIQTTSERMVPTSTYEAVVKERDAARRRVKDLEQQVAKLSQNPLEKYLKAAAAVKNDILQTLKTEIANAAGMKPEDITVIPEQGILRLSGDVLFPRGVSSITPGSLGDRAIQSLALALSKVLPCFSLGPASNANKECNPNAAFIDAVFIEGHTDDQPIKGILEGGVTDNFSLSARRAINTAEAIYAYQPTLKEMFSIVPSEQGAKLGEGHSPLIDASAFGETRPVVSNATAAGKKSNRRIDVRVLMYTPNSENLEAVRKLLVR